MTPPIIRRESPMLYPKEKHRPDGPRKSARVTCLIPNLSNPNPAHLSLNLAIKRMQTAAKRTVMARVTEVATAIATLAATLAATKAIPKRAMEMTPTRTMGAIPTIAMEAIPTPITAATVTQAVPTRAMQVTKHSTPRCMRKLFSVRKREREPTMKLHPSQSDQNH